MSGGAAASTAVWRTRNSVGKGGLRRPGPARPSGTAPQRSFSILPPAAPLGHECPTARPLLLQQQLCGRLHCEVQEGPPAEAIQGQARHVIQARASKGQG